jgi:hypothetical protein
MRPEDDLDDDDALDDDDDPLNLSPAEIEEFARMNPFKQAEVLWREARRAESRMRRLMGILQVWREKFGEAKVQEMAEDPDPLYDGLRELLRIERSREEKKFRN